MMIRHLLKLLNSSRINLIYLMFLLKYDYFMMNGPGFSKYLSFIDALKVAISKSIGVIEKFTTFSFVTDHFKNNFTRGFS
jgi:hypothetical protein